MFTASANLPIASAPLPARWWASRAFGAAIALARRRKHDEKQQSEVGHAPGERNGTFDCHCLQHHDGSSRDNQVEGAFVAAQFLFWPRPARVVILTYHGNDEASTKVLAL